MIREPKSQDFLVYIEIRPRGFEVKILYKIINKRGGGKFPFLREKEKKKKGQMKCWVKAWVMG